MRAGLVTFEGIDGSGKTTVSRLVAERLAARGTAVFLTSEPTDGWTGDAVRRSYDEDVGPVTEAFLFLADRAGHVEEIRRRIAAGDLVLCDRYADSTYAYQGARLHGVVDNPIAFLRRSSEPWLVTPDLTFLLRVSPDTAVRRMGGRATMRFENREFLERVAANYDGLARGRRYVILDGERPAQEVASEAVAAIDRRLRGRGPR